MCFMTYHLCFKDLTTGKEWEGIFCDNKQNAEKLLKETQEARPDCKVWLKPVVVVAK